MSGARTYASQLPLFSALIVPMKSAPADELRFGLLQANSSFHSLRRPSHEQHNSQAEKDDKACSSVLIYALLGMTGDLGSWLLRAIGPQRLLDPFHGT